MHQRYEIATHEAPPARSFPNRFKPVVDRLKLARMLIREAFHYRFRKEILLSRPCIYGVFSGPVGGFWPLKDKCVGCLRCVQEYPDMCRVLIDERWKALGDSYFDADSVSTLNFEATTGKIMVKGVGYKGKFSGEGFDSMWTDMSEIVRPTRDGLYGRENISTAVDIGRKPKRLMHRGAVPAVIQVPLPILFDFIPEKLLAPGVVQSIASAAGSLQTIFLSKPLHKEDAAKIPPSARLVEFIWHGNAAAVKALLESHPQQVFCARLPLNNRAFEAIVNLYRLGLGAFHLSADYHGREKGAQSPRFISDSILDLHRALVREGIRDEITLIASGGIVRAEHVPKIILCGADLVALDTPVLAALGAQWTGEEITPDSGHLKVHSVKPAWGAQRLVNFCASWRNQLLEIASAMGIKDVRRMRGETGRLIFREDLEREWLAR